MKSDFSGLKEESTGHLVVIGEHSLIPLVSHRKAHDDQESWKAAAFKQGDVLGENVGTSWPLSCVL